MTGHRRLRPLGVAAIVVLAACGKVQDGRCGDGTVGAGEACDDGASNGQPGSCCTATCDAVGDGMPCAGGNGVNACSAADSCQAGACSNNDLAAGARCSSDACRLERCDAAGGCAMPAGLRVTIIESESMSADQLMDQKWQAQAEAVGYVPTIVAQTTLDDIAGLADTDILIVASHEIVLPDSRITTIAAFVASGRGVYIQGEFQASFAGNKTWESVVDSFGAGFTWGAEVPNLFQATAVGCSATTPFVVSAISQNFGVTGSATSSGFSVIEVAPGNVGIGFAFCRPGGGLAITKTDKDDIRAQSSGVPELMKNILYQLSFAPFCSM